MLKHSFFILIMILCFGLAEASAGWYECYNFKGSIGKYPIEMSIQVRKGYFGEKQKKEYNIIGVYKYDKFNNPIRLEGKLDFKTNKALLYEISKGSYSATFEFDFTLNECHGFWKHIATNQSLTLNLKHLSTLTDTLRENEFKNVKVLQTSALHDFYFVGIYSKLAGQDQAQMNSLDIIQKRNNLLYQTIDFSKTERQTGNVMTIIYDNVGIEDLKSRLFNVSYDAGRMGGNLKIFFDLKTQRFKVNPVPQMEGPN